MARHTSLLAVALWSLLATAASSQEIALEKRHTRWRLSYEVVDLDRREDIGLLGVHYDLLNVSEAFPPLYVGMGGFAAVNGEEDGLFLAGLTLGTAWSPFPLWILDTGVFVGAGNDAGGPPSDGWAVRPFAAIERIFGLYGVRAEVAYLDMDEFEPEWTFGLGLTLPSELLVGRESERARRIPATAIRHRTARITPRFLGLRPDSDATLRDGSPHDRDASLGGLGFDYFLTPYLFLPVEAYGATGGGVDGFVLAAAGIGGSVPVLFPWLRLEAKASLVTGGGGAVDTGSGVGWQALGGLRADLTRRLSVELMGGHLSFHDAEFDADAVTLGLSWRTDPIELDLRYPRGNLEREGLSDADARLERTRFVLSSKLYQPPSDARNKAGEEYDSTLPLLGFGIEHPVHEYVTLTARGHAAAGGEIGGYSEGMLGASIGFRPADSIARIAIDLEAGAAGGGNVDLGSGVLFQIGLSAEIDLTDSTSLSVGWGKAEASKGSFEAEAFTFGLGWNLSRPVLRH